MKVSRTIRWDEHGDPYLCIQPKVNPEKYPPFAIPVKDAWMYSRDHNPGRFSIVTGKAVCWMYERWNIGLITREGWAEIAAAIEDRIGDLLKAPPRESYIDLAVKQMLDESFSDAVKNAEVNGNNVKMTFKVPA